MTFLTTRQREVLRYITNYQVEHDGFSPTLMELRALLGVSSDNGVLKHMRILQAAGELATMPDKHRGIGITQQAKRMLAEKWSHETRFFTTTQ